MLISNHSAYISWEIHNSFNICFLSLPQGYWYPKFESQLKEYWHPKNQTKKNNKHRGPKKQNSRKIMVRSIVGSDMDQVIHMLIYKQQYIKHFFISLFWFLKGAGPRKITTSSSFFFLPILKMQKWFEWKPFSHFKNVRQIDLLQLF
jgi:hypothetical protein